MTTTTTPFEHQRRSAATPDPTGRYRKNNALKVATIGGIQIFLDWTWLLAFVFLTWSLGTYYAVTFPSWGPGTSFLIGGVSTILLFVTVLLHELGHSFTARSLGLPVNSITLFIFGGVSNLSEEPQTPRIELLLAAAGPLVSLVLAGIFYLLHAAAGGGSSEVSAILGYLASVNLILALFNLIPAFPLDGGRVFRSIAWWITGSMQRATRLATDVSKGFAWLFIAAGLLEALLLGQFISGLWLAFIGWFLYNSASASSQQAVLDQVLQGVAVADVMDEVPASIGFTVTVQSLIFDHLLDGRHRAVAVQGPDGSLLGLVTVSDLRHLRQEDWPTTLVSRIMTPSAALLTVAPTDDLRRAMRLLAGNGYHQLPVMEDGRLVGMLNQDDVLQYLELRQFQSRQPAPASSIDDRSMTPPAQRRAG